MPNWQQLVLRRLMAFSFCFEETHGLQNRRQTLFGVLTPVFGFSEKRKSTLNFVSQPQRKRKKKGKEKELPKEKNAHASICQHKNKRQKKKEKERNSGPAEDTTNTARGFDFSLWVFQKRREARASACLPRKLSHDKSYQEHAPREKGLSQSQP